MPNPTPYTQAYDFSDFASDNPSTPLPGDRLDIELANLGRTANETVGALLDIRRSDGKLKNGIVTKDSLAPGLLPAGFLEANAKDIAFAPSGGLSSSDVQAALVELDTEKQPLDADLSAIALLTTTAYGRALLTLANNAALVAELAAAYQPLDTDLTAIAALTTQTFGRARLTDTAAKDGRAAYVVPAYVATRTAMKALDVTKDSVAVLTEAGRAGTFILRTGAAPISDPGEGVYVVSNTASFYWERIIAGDLMAPWWGVVAGDNATDETTQVQQALTFAGSWGGYNRAFVVIPSGQRVYCEDHLTFPAGVGLRIDGAYLRVADANSLRVNSNCSIVGINGKIELESDFGTGAVIRAQDPSTPTSNLIIGGFTMEGPGTGNENVRAVDLSSFYNSTIFISTISQFGVAYYHTGSVQLYYTTVEVYAIQVNKAFVSLGTLFNGSEINVRRCVPTETGIDLRNTTGVLLKAHYIEGAYTSYGIRLDHTRATKIWAAMIEIDTVSTAGIRGIFARDTTIICDWGGPGDSAAKRAIFDSDSTGTTLICGEDSFFHIDGAILVVPFAQGSKTYNPPSSLAVGASVSTTVTVAGARMGDKVGATFSLDTLGVILSAQVSAANTVTVTFLNPTTGSVDLRSATIGAATLRSFLERQTY